MEINYDSLILDILLFILVFIGFKFKDNKTFMTIAIGILVGIAIIITIVETIQNLKELKKKKLFKKILWEKSELYYKNKYNENLNIHHIKLNSFRTNFFKTHFNTGYVYLDKEETKYIYVSLNDDSTICEIYDNLQDEKLVKDSMDLINKCLNKFDIKFLIRLNKTNVVLEQKPYKNNLKEYLKVNNIKIDLTIVNIIKGTSKMDNLINYYDKFSEEIVSIIDETLNIDNVNIGISFFDKKLPNGIDEEDLEKKFDDIWILVDCLDIPYKKIKTDKYSYLYII